MINLKIRKFVCDTKKYQQVFILQIHTDRLHKKD